MISPGYLVRTHDGLRAGAAGAAANAQCGGAEYVRVGVWVALAAAAAEAAVGWGAIPSEAAKHGRGGTVGHGHVRGHVRGRVPGAAGDS